MVRSADNRARGGSVAKADNNTGDARAESVKAAWWVSRALANKTEQAVHAVTAGLGSGKTHGICQALVERTTLNSRSPYAALFMPINRLIKDTAIPTFRKVLNSFRYVEGIDYDITPSGELPRITFAKTKQEIHLRSAENPERIAGVEYHTVGMDELAIIQVEAFRNARTRARCSLATVRQTFVGMSPQGINWAADEFDSGNFSLDETKAGWERLSAFSWFKPSSLYYRYQLRTDDNPFVTKGYVDSLELTYGHNRNLIRSYRYGEFCPLVEGSAYANYMPQIHDLDDVPADPYREIALTWDFNAAPLAWVAVQKMLTTESYARRFEYVSVEEANEGNNNLDDTVVEFARKFPVEKFRDTLIKLYGDRTGHARSHKISGSDFEAIERYLRQLGYRNIEIAAARQVAPEAESIDAVNRLFLGGILFINKKCRMLRRSLMATVWKEGTRKLEKPAGETHTHHGDALKYWAWQTTRDDTGADTKQIFGLNV